MKKWILLGLVFLLSFNVFSNHSVARKWNEAVLEGIRNDFARPTVHARNLFHTSIAMYDAWSVYSGTSETYLLGKSVNGHYYDFRGVSIPSTSEEIKAAQEKAMSYAVYRIMRHRFANSPGALAVITLIDNLMAELGYDTNVTSTDYTQNDPAALGNYIAEIIIDYGLKDGSNEVGGYENLYYTPVNDPLIVDGAGNPTMTDPNRWQPLTLDVFIDQSGNEIPGSTPAFLGPEWGMVYAFSLNEANLDIFNRNGEYYVYHDPGAPPYLEPDGSGGSDDYKWTFSLVALWSSHLDPTDNVMIDISPGSLGNTGPTDSYPVNFSDYDQFYDRYEGGDIGTGRAINPFTGQPYAPNIVPRGDYTRVLAEFWADGPDSETPPGHWFTIINTVNDHPALVKKFMGTGDILDDLEWDVKSYFLLGGTMHDCAVTQWGIKGWYDLRDPFRLLDIWPTKVRAPTHNCQTTHRRESPLSLAILS